MKNYLIGVVGVLFAQIAAGEAPLWQFEGMLPSFSGNAAEFRQQQADIQSASRWLWRAGSSRKGETASFRAAFDVPGKVKKAVFNVYSDGCGRLWMNGDRVTLAQLGESVCEGRNVFAATVSNSVGNIGLMVYGDIELADGRHVSVNSSAESFKVADGIPQVDGWELPEFDDSAWRPATELGDVWLGTLGKKHDLASRFATVKEQVVKALAPVPYNVLCERIKAEPEPDAKVVWIDGMPKISLNGKIVDAVFNQSGSGNDFKHNAAAKSQSLGIAIHQLTFRESHFEKGPGIYDFSHIGERARELLEAVPDARILLLVRMGFPKWAKAHPEAQIGFAKGPITDIEGGDDIADRTARPSAASPEFRAEMHRFLSLLSKYVRSQPWGKRVVALRPSWGIYTEWHTYAMYDGPDTGPAMTAAFHRWKGGKYAHANPPTMAERMTDDAFLFDTSKHQKLIDYYECMANEVADLMLDTAKTAKKEFPGRLVGMYYGYVITTHPAEGANVMLDKVLASPDIDFLSNPSAYSESSRLSGGSYYHRTIPATFRRYKKLCMLEDDMRHYHILDFVSHKKICTSGPREAEMTTRRNWLSRYFDSCGIQMLDPEHYTDRRPFSMDVLPVWRAMYDTKKVLDDLGERPADSGNDTAVVFDWRECLRMTPKESSIAEGVYIHAIVGLYASGVPVDLMTLDDFLAQPANRYRKAVFCNVFSAPDAKLRGELQKRVSAADFKSAWLVRCPFGTPAGGRVYERVPKGGDAWRDLLTGIGARPVGPAGHYIRRHGDVVMFHTGATGKWELELPGCEGATELFSGRRYTGSKVTVTTDGSDTLCLRFDRKSGK